MPTKDGTAASGGRTLTGEGSKDGLSPFPSESALFVGDGIVDIFTLPVSVPVGQEASVHVYRNGLHLALVANPVNRTTFDTYWIEGDQLLLGAPPRDGNKIYATTKA
jgi:hypothetical protein